MERALDVYLNEHLVGRLVQDQSGNIRFAYAESWISKPNAVPLSYSLPLKSERFTSNECRGFFGGLLPEQSQREIIAKNLGISARNDFALLREIGGECAGAVTFIPTGENLPNDEHDHRELTEDELADTLRRLPSRPLLAGDEGIRLSLAGAQNKIAVHVFDNRISIPLGGAPSTHILKPAIERFEGVVFNEAFCMRLAQSIGLPTAKVEIGRAQNVDYLLVERYDRSQLLLADSSPAIRRLHQEDFCQAMGIISNRKYQNEGGPSLKNCFDLLREASSTPVIDLQSLLDAAIFNFLIGNNDAHGKNFSLLYKDENVLRRQTRLAPLYDLLSTAYYSDLSPRMAMKIGGEYEADQVHAKHFELLAEEVKFAKLMVSKRVPELAQRVLAQTSELLSKIPAARAVADLISIRCARTIKRFEREQPA